METAIVGGIAFSLGAILFSTGLRSAKNARTAKKYSDKANFTDPIQNDNEVYYVKVTGNLKNPNWKISITNKTYKVVYQVTKMAKTFTGNPTSFFDTTVCLLDCKTDRKVAAITISKTDKRRNIIRLIPLPGPLTEQHRVCQKVGTDTNASKAEELLTNCSTLPIISPKKPKNNEIRKTGRNNKIDKTQVTVYKESIPINDIGDVMLDTVCLPNTHSHVQNPYEGNELVLNKYRKKSFYEFSYTKEFFEKLISHPEYSSAPNYRWLNNGYFERIIEEGGSYNEIHERIALVQQLDHSSKHFKLYINEEYCDPAIAFSTLVITLSRSFYSKQST